MMPKTYDVLVIEDNDADAALIRHNISESEFSFAVRRVGTFRDGEKAVHAKLPDALLLDLNLPDSAVTITFRRMQEIVKDRFPIIVMTGTNDQAVIEDAFNHGAQEYIIKDQTAVSIGHLTKHAIERHRVTQARIKAASVVGVAGVMGPEGLASREAIRESKAKVSLDQLNANIAQLRRLASG